VSTPYESQNDAFGAGVNHPINQGHANAASISLDQAGESFTSAVLAGQNRPHSVLQGLQGYQPNPGGLGMSAEDAANRLPDGQWMGSADGMSQDSYEPTRMLHMSGDDGEL
jgi:hypothetical protein